MTFKSFLNWRDEFVMLRIFDSFQEILYYFQIRIAMKRHVQSLCEIVNVFFGVAEMRHCYAIATSKHFPECAVDLGSPVVMPGKSLNGHPNRHPSRHFQSYGLVIHDVIVTMVNAPSVSSRFQFLCYHLIQSFSIRNYEVRDPLSPPLVELYSRKWTLTLDFAIYAPVATSLRSVLCLEPAQGAE